MVVGSPTLGVDGQPFVWDNTRVIQYRTDGGTLGTMDNASAVNLVAQAFATWASVPTAHVAFQRVGSIQGVADGDVSTIAELDAVFGSCQQGTQSPIMFDDGSLLQQLTGDASIVGLTGPCTLTPAGKIGTAFSVLANPPNLPAGYMQAIAAHEFGHFLGLDHTDVKQPLTGGTTQQDIDNTPTMYWSLITPSQATLSNDDMAWISRLYPNGQYSATYGTITGQVFFSDGQTPVQDVLVIARSLTDPHTVAVASISGYLFTGNPGQTLTSNYLPCGSTTACPNGYYGDNSAGSRYGSRNAALRGRFDIPVPAGQYTVEVRQMSNDGKIGPINPPFTMPGREEYWDADESNHDWAMPAAMTQSPGVVTVNAGQTVDNINIILNGTDGAFDIFEQPLASLAPGGVSWKAWLDDRKGEVAR